VILLDTHVLVWMDTSDRRLGRKSRALIDEYWPAGKVSVSAISFWEVGRLNERGRIRLGMTIQEWRSQWLAAGILELPLDGNAATRALDLSGLPEDPADRFITATAILHDATLMTADGQLLGWRHTLKRQNAGN
jgi:PIN domain nuclease of toxin-antitoxin system